MTDIVSSTTLGTLFYDQNAVEWRTVSVRSRWLMLYSPELQRAYHHRFYSDHPGLMQGNRDEPRTLVSKVTPTSGTNEPAQGVSPLSYITYVANGNGSLLPVGGPRNAQRILLSFSHATTFDSINPCGMSASAQRLYFSLQATGTPKKAPGRDTWANGHILAGSPRVANWAELYASAISVAEVLHEASLFYNKKSDEHLTAAVNEASVEAHSILRFMKDIVETDASDITDEEVVESRKLVATLKKRIPEMTNLFHGFRNASNVLYAPVPAGSIYRRLFLLFKSWTFDTESKQFIGTKADGSLVTIDLRPKSEFFKSTPQITNRRLAGYFGDA